MFGPSVGKLDYLSGFRLHLDSNNFALATIAPGKISSVSPVDIYTFQTSHGHVHEILLCSTAKQLGVVLEGSLRECERYLVLANRSAGQLQQRPIRYLVVCSSTFVEKSLLSRSEETIHVAIL